MSIAYQRTSRGPVAGRLAGKAVEISGTGGGQGRAAALLFARSGAAVVGCDRKSDGLEETRVGRAGKAQVATSVSAGLAQIAAFAVDELPDLKIREKIHLRWKLGRSGTSPRRRDQRFALPCALLLSRLAIWDAILWLALPRQELPHPQQRKGMSRASAYGGAAPNHLARINDLIEPLFVYVSGLNSSFLQA